jgi:starch phosphorylase
VACAGKFSSDRAIREYCETIWEARPVPVKLSD